MSISVPMAPRQPVHPQTVNLVSTPEIYGRAPLRRRVLEVGENDFDEAAHICLAGDPGLVWLVFWE